MGTYVDIILFTFRFNVLFHFLIYLAFNILLKLTKLHRYSYFVIYSYDLNLLELETK